MALTLRSTKGSMLTHTEMDNNFTYLQGLIGGVSNFDSGNASQLIDAAYIQSRQSYAYASLTGAPSLSTVATSGSYTDLINRPALAAVSTSGSYNDLSNRPTLFSGAYADLTGKPVLATVATSGSYNDLSNQPTLFSGAYADLTGKPTLATVATSGNYVDLSNKPDLGRTQLTVYTVDTLPSGGSEGELIYVQDGDAGSPCLAVLDGNGDYLVVSTLGSAVSTGGGGGGF
jgi:hypothetical protein